MPILFLIYAYPIILFSIFNGEQMKNRGSFYLFYGVSILHLQWRTSFFSEAINIFYFIKKPAFFTL